MTQPPKLQAYMITLVFGEGPIFLNAIVAPSEIAAVAGVTAMSMAQVLRETEVREGEMPPLPTGVACLPLTAEWMRSALRQLETGKVESEVVKLVPREPEQRSYAPYHAAARGATSAIDHRPGCASMLTNGATCNCGSWGGAA